MRTSHLASFLLLSSSLALAACGGAVASPSDGQGSGPGGSSGSSGASDPPGSGSAAGSTGTGSKPASCTPGASVFCRCADRSEGTRQCDDTGRTFNECLCNPDAFPPPPPDCAYPPTSNPAGCPTTYSHAYQGEPCPTLDLQCTYPGAGDGDANGCASTAGLRCMQAFDGGAPSWVATQ